MAAGFPVKADYASGDVLTAAQMNDLSSTLNYLDPTAKGDLFPASSGTALTRLAVGANDTVLTADSSTATGLKWAAAATGGGMTLISTTTLTGASVTLSSIPQTYNDLHLVIRNFQPATDDVQILGRFNADSGANRHRTLNLDTSTIPATFNATFFQFTQYNDNSVATGLSIARFYDYTNTTTWKFAKIDSISVDPNTTTSFGPATRYAVYNQIAGVSSLELFPNTGNFTSGTALLYGVK